MDLLQYHSDVEQTVINTTSDVWADRYPEESRDGFGSSITVTALFSPSQDMRNVIQAQYALIWFTRDRKETCDLYEDIWVIFILSNAGYHFTWNELNHVYIIGTDISFGIMYVL
jgi:hypothetical protein